MFDFRCKETLRANISTSTRLLSLRGENFRWADLVSGNLKEEKNAHSPQVLHSSGPQHQPRNLLFRYARKQIRHGRVWGSVVYFWWKASTNATLVESKHKRNLGGKRAQTQPLRRNDSHNGCGSRPLLKWASFFKM